MKKPRIILAGTGSGVGKTSVSAGIMAALTARGLLVQPYKVGPDYIDPAFHTFVTGRTSRNLDSWLLSEATVRALFVRNAPSSGEGLSIIEGVMGLFDGHSRVDKGSTADVAEIVQAPVVLIINGASTSRSAAAVVHGFNTFKAGFKLAGVIINQVAGAGHYELLKKYIEQEAGVPCFGFLPKNPAFALESRHLGLVPSVEVKDLSERLALLADNIKQTIDLDGLLELAAQAPGLSAPIIPPQKVAKSPVRIGLAQDNAFNFYYQDSLDLLTELGAELVPFSPISDKALPPSLSGLYIGGGFPEVFAKELTANSTLRHEILEKLNAGMPCYAECGGLMYLGNKLTDEAGEEHKMMGFFPHTTAMTKKLQNFGYVELTFTADTVLGPCGTTIKAHEFHHSAIMGDTPNYVMDIQKSPTRAWQGGLTKNNVLAAYPHIHFQANQALAEHFVNKCREYKG